MTDFSKAQLFSTASSQKVFKEGGGTFSVAALPGAGEVHTTATIPHTYGDNLLIFQVVMSRDLGGTTNFVIAPWRSSDGRITQYAYLDSSNLYITCISTDSGGGGAPARTVNYSYRLLIP